MNIKRIVVVVVLAAVVVGAVYLAVWVPTGLLLKVLVVCGFIVLIILGLFWKYRCSSCRRVWALRTSGREEGRMPITKMEEWKCKHCGRTVWKKSPFFAGGG